MDYRSDFCSNIFKISHRQKKVCSDIFQCSILLSIYTALLGATTIQATAEDSQLYLSLHPGDPTVGCSNLGLDKRALPAQHSQEIPHRITVQLDSSTITPSRSVRNFGALFEDQLNFTDHFKPGHADLRSTAFRTDILHLLITN